MKNLSRIFIFVCLVIFVLFPAATTKADQKMKCEIEQDSLYTYGCWIVWSGNRKWIATSHKKVDGIDIWDAKTHEHLLKLPVHAEAITPHPRQDLLASVTNYRITIWNILTGEEIQSYNFHSFLEAEYQNQPENNYWSIPDRFSAITWNIATDQIVVVGNKWFGVWNVDTNEFISFLIQDDAPRSDLAAIWSPDAQTLALGNGTIQLYEAGTLNLYKQFGQDDPFMNPYRGLQSLSWSPDGRFLAADGISQAEPTNIVIRIYEVATGELSIIESHSSPINAVAWSPDGKFIASAGGDDFLGYPADNAIRIWDAETHELFQEYTYDQPITSISWKPDGTQLAAVDLDGVVYILDIKPVD